MLFRLFSNMKLLKKLLKNNSIKTRGSLLIAATLFGNFFNFAYNAYLGRAISIEDFALISLMGSFLGLADIPINALGRSVTHKSAFLLGKYKRPAQKFWLSTRKRAFLVSLLITLGWLAITPFLQKYFHLESMMPLFAIAPIWIFGILSSVDGGYIKGNLMFGYLAVVSIVEALLRFIIVFWLANLGLGKYVYFSLPVSSFSTLLLVAFFASRLKKNNNNSEKRNSTAFPFKFFTSTAMTKVSATVYLTFDVILAKHFLPAEQAGQYALLSLTGKMVYFAGSLFSQFILPLVSHKEGEGTNSHKTFFKLLCGTFLASFSAYTVVGLFGNYTLQFLFGEKVAPIIPYASAYAGAMVAFTISTNIVAYHQIRNQYLLPFMSFLLAMSQLLLINLFHESIGDIANVMVGLGFASLLIIGTLHFMHDRFMIFLSNVNDFVDLFKPFSVKSKGTRILILNWRDTKHLWSGGAEVYIKSLADEWVKMGHHVSIFCGNDGKSKRNEVVNRVHVIRRGGFYTVYLWAFLYYAFKLRKNFDVIIDSENGIPFFSPLYSRKAIVLLIHHVHQEIFMTHLNFPFSHVAKFLEGKFMPFVYKKSIVVTVSKSSKEEIVKAGISRDDNIQIVNPGIRLSVTNVGKTKHPTFVYLGRLKPYKNVDIAISAFSKVHKIEPTSKLIIAGEGDSMKSLIEQTNNLGLENYVEFLGKVSEKKKQLILAQSWVALQPSTVEGWGITVLEANAHGTPVIASHVNGLKDSIIHGKTGLLVKVKSVSELEKAMLKLVNDRALRKSTSKNAYEWAKEFSWDRNANSFYQILSQSLEKKSERKIFPNLSLPTLNRN